VKRVCFRGWLGSALEMGGGGAERVVEPTLLHHEMSPLMCFGHLIRILLLEDMGGGPGVDPEHAAGVINLSCPWNASGYPRTSWRVSPGMSGFLFWTCWLHNPTLDKQKMD